MNAALLIAGGSGSRMHQDIPKQFLSINGKPVIIYTLEAFDKHPEIDEIAVACIAGWEQALRTYAEQYGIRKLRCIVPGGKNGQASIRNGLFELERRLSPEDMVLVHDANRPMVSAKIISDCIRVARQRGNATAAIPCVEAVLKTDDGAEAGASIPRDTLRRTQTPQAFRLKDICALHRRALEAGITNSVSSCTLMIELGEKVFFSAGSEKNLKLTTMEDIDIFRALLASEAEERTKL